MGTHHEFQDRYITRGRRGTHEKIYNLLTFISIIPRYMMSINDEGKDFVYFIIMCVQSTSKHVSSYKGFVVAGKNVDENVLYAK